MAHPGGNVTGLALNDSELYGKRLELLREALPAIKHVALLINGANSSATETLRWSQAASRSLGIQLEAFDVRDFEDLEKTLDKMSRVGVQALIVTGDVTLQANAKQLGGLALKHQLPMMGTESVTGVLLRYGADNLWVFRRAAAYVEQDPQGR